MERKMRKKIVQVVLIFHLNADASQWFCKEGASSKNNNSYEVCGIGTDYLEDEARKNALKNAFEEFDLVCNKSDDCKGKFKEISPLRTDCENGQKKYKCYRSFKIQVNPKKESYLSHIKSESLLNDKKWEENNYQKCETLFDKTDGTIKNDKLQKLSFQIRKKIQNKNRIVEKYLKRGMNMKEVLKILSTPSDSFNYTSLNTDDYLIYGTYKILFNTIETRENSPILEAACDISDPNHCINIEP